jgi:hypothetical protein
MSDASETQHAELLRRLRAERPSNSWFLCGYPGDGPPGFDRIEAPDGVRFVDVPSVRVRERHDIPAGGPRRQRGTVLIVEPDVIIRIRRRSPADLVDGPILRRLVRLARLPKCYTIRTRTPRHQPVSGWLHPGDDSIRLEDSAPGPVHRRRI